MSTTTYTTKDDTYTYTEYIAGWSTLDGFSEASTTIHPSPYPLVAFPTPPAPGSVPCGVLDNFEYNATDTFIPDPDIGGVGVRIHHPSQAIP